MDAVISGALTAGPAAVGDVTFPVASYNTPIAGTVSYKVGAPGGPREVATSSNVYAALSGVGTTDTVKKALLLYIRANNAVLLRLTTYSAGGDVVAVLPIKGAQVLTFDPDRYLKLVEVSGTATVEWFACGQE